MIDTVPHPALNWAMSQIESHDSASIVTVAVPGGFERMAERMLDSGIAVTGATIPDEIEYDDAADAIASALKQRVRDQAISDFRTQAALSVAALRELL